MGKEKKKYPIRLSDWHCSEGKKKLNVVVKGIVVSGEHSDLLAISRSDAYLVRLYKTRFGDKYQKKMKDGVLKVKRITLNSKILGMGVGCIDQSTETKR